ncbi:uncharacterized protein LOC127801673 isoform X2 [Diospyros lotus]|uniref:uncharacterized protein LOC127801673 isoform X2 n=1 Tax=Diospyros lotus TaxID=55363 RepID=UPI00224E45CC|nr:uncharacterized protein LOC127801673 isoform X2 [Diospyros lotus]
MEEETLNSANQQSTEAPMEEAEQQSDSEHQNPTNPPDAGSDSESDSDSDDEARETLQIETLEAELASNPSNYDAHVQYIRALRKKGEIEKLHGAREAMSKLFPLSPTMWQEWAKDEATLSSTLSSGSESFHAIEKLYERGIFDYLSVSLWCDYLNFVQEHDPSVREWSPEGISKARKLFERAITAAGLHVAEGTKIWEAYREFELAVLCTIGETDVEAREKQVQRIRNIFHRQLSVPHGDSKSTLLAYKSWEVEQRNAVNDNSNDLDGIPSHVASSYKKALEMLNARIHFEEQISKQTVPDVERLQEYMAYLKFEQSSGGPARVQILYERAVTEFPISNDLWLDYTRYLDRTLKVGSIIKDVYSRATKNCPWVGELWVRYLLSLERCHASEKEIALAFERSLLCTFSSFEEYLDIFLTRVDGIRRRISQAGEAGDALDYALIRETFQHAFDYLSPHLKGTDALLRMHSYWARLESKLGNDLVAARGVWESLLKNSGSALEAWQGYIAMEIEMGNISEARSLYRRCYSKRFPGTGSEDICHLWLCFEREFGTLEDFDYALQKVTPRLEELQLFRLQQESKNIDTINNLREPSKKSARERKRQGQNIADEQPTAKRQRDTVSNITKARERDKAPEDLVEANKIESFPVHDVKTSTIHEKEKKDFIPEKHKYNDQCTAFISNLSLKATYDDLRGFFSDTGGVVGIRILKDKYTGKSRGLAYVDFSSDAHLIAALEKNRKMFLGKKLSIARSDPKQGRKKESAGHSTPLEYGNASGTPSAVGESDSQNSSTVAKGSAGTQPQSANHRGDGNIQLTGKNTFAVPRAVRPLGWTDKNRKKPEEAQEGEDEKPKSNDEFRKMFLKR